MHLDCHADQWLGLRENQEDCVLLETLGGKVDNPRYLLLVADGMGGHAAGEVASRLVADDILKSIKSASREANIEPVLRKALQDANDKLAAAIEENVDYSGMGTTLVAVVVDGKNVYWISVGDSLFYLIREDQIRRLNEDHSMAGLVDQMAAAGKISQEEAASSSDRHVLRSVVCGEDIPLIDVGFLEGGLQSGDRLIVASDGIETLGEEQIAALITESVGQEASFLAQAILNSVKEVKRRHQDNVSLIVGVFEDEMSKQENWFDRLWSAISKR